MHHGRPGRVPPSSSVPFGGDHCRHHPDALNLGFGSCHQPLSYGPLVVLLACWDPFRRVQSREMGGKLGLRKGISELGEEVGHEEELLWLEIG